MKRYARLVLVCCLGIILSACGGGGNNNPDPDPDPTPNDDAARIIAALVANLKGQSDLSIKAEGSAGEGVLATGTVDAEGNIKLELPKTVGEAFLLPLEPNDGCVFNPATNAKSFLLPNLTVYVKDKLAGVLVQEDNTGVLERVFVSEDATIECTNAEANASFKKGWNLVFIDKATQIGKVIASSTAPWTFTGNISNTPDTTPPTVLDTFATSETSVEVVFSEAIQGVAVSQFEFPAQDLTISAASLSADKTTVTLTTTAQTVNESYALLVRSGITDLAGNAFDLSASDPLTRTFEGFNPSNGLLEINILGLPSGVAANVEVTGPNSFKQTLTASTVLDNVPIGTYSLAINDVKPDSATFSKTAESPTTVQVAAGIRTIVPLAYSCTRVAPPDANLDAFLKTATGKETYTCDDLAALTSLTAFDKAIQNIEGLQYAIGLTFLDLADNQLSSLPENIFDNLTALTVLDLEANQLSSLPENIFDNLTALRFLRLGGNQLTSLPENIFDNLTNLTEIRLFGNQLSSLPQSVFDNLTALAFLDLQDNCLEATKVPTRGQLAALASRVTLSASNNPKAGCAAVLQPVTLSNFDTTPEGWTVIGGATDPSHVATSGNPGGFIQAADSVQGSIWYWIAPALYYGDARDYIGTTLKFSLKQSTTEAPFDDVDVILFNEVENLSIEADITAPGTSFTEYTITLTPESFSPVLTREAFQLLFEKLSVIQIRGEYSSTLDDTGGLDSVRFGE